MSKWGDLENLTWDDLKETTWSEVRLGDVVNINKENIKNTFEGKILYVDISSVESGILKGFTKYNFKDAPSRARRVVKEGDIIYSTVRPNLRAYYKFGNNIPNNIIASTGFVVLSKKTGTSIDYIYYLSITNSFVDHISQIAKGAAYPAVGIEDFKNIKIQIPDLKTQEKISDLLSTYDELIENNNRRIEILEKTAEEIYKEWFVRMRFPGHENTKFIKGIPEGWEVKRVGDLAKFKRGKNLVIRDAIPGEVPVIAGGMEPSCYHNESNTNAPVITVSASGANAGYTQLNHVDIWASDCSYIDINDTYLIYYIYLLLKVSHKEILNLQLGSAQPHVYARDLNNFKFLKPDMKLIKKINNHAKDIFGEIKYLSSTNQNLIKQRDLLLPRLMNGTIEVK